MILDPITRNKITNIVFTASEPTSTSVIWAKPNGDVVTLYVYKKGSWSKIPSEGIDELVKEYVDAQDALTLATAEKYSDNNFSSAKDYTDSSSKELTEKINKKVGTVEVKKSSTNDLLYTLYVDGQASGNITIPEDKFLKKVSYDSTTKKLTFIFNTETGETTTTIDVSDLVDTYTAGNGLSLSGNKFSVVVSSDSESYLKVTSNGIKLEGVANTLNDCKKATESANIATKAAISVTDEASKVNIEVSDDDIITITDRKGTQRQMIFYAASEDLASYGIEFDTTVSNPACTRIGNMDYHKSLPVHSLMKGCLLDDDGNLVKYLDPSDWTGETRDGSEGQVMVEIPQHYRKFETDGTKRRVKISTQPLAGFHKVPKMYVSAYQAALDRTNLKLCSIVNTDAQYRGGNNNANYDGTYRSFLGMPATSANRTNFRKYARARKADSTEWNCMTYDIQKTLYWLFVIEYATLNSQATYNATLTDEGYHQGGLGAGVTGMSDWGDYNGTYPIIPCGVTDSLGNTTGVVTHNVIASDGESTHYAAPVPRYRGVENPFGHLWQWTDGINMRIAPDEANGGDGLSKVYVCSDPAKFTDTSYDGYTYVGDEARSNGSVKEVIFGEYGEIMPKAVGGGSNTYFCDYHYTAIPTSANSLRGVLFGGSAYHGSFAGFACAYSYRAPSSAYANFASRLCFIPE